MERLIFAACLMFGAIMYLRDGDGPAKSAQAVELSGQADGAGTSSDSGATRWGRVTWSSTGAVTAISTFPSRSMARSVEMMVDTGASGIALALDDARRAGVATSIGMTDYVGDGASGAVYGDNVDLERVRLGTVELDHVSAVVLSGGETSLLGQDFLRHFKRVEIDGDRMVLSSGG